jgi:hypothetical protein
MILVALAGVVLALGSRMHKAPRDLDAPVTCVEDARIPLLPIAPKPE